jgi:1-acyl-sn-glycerol-3-phosphate acyltransferase
VLLTRLGIPKLWQSDVEVAWSFMRWWLAPVTMLLAPSYAYGVERVPAAGGGVLAANHLAAIDPPLIGSFSRRGIWWMVKAELFSIPVIGEIFSWAGGFPIRRGESDREGLRIARELVRDGHLIGVFVEGTRQRLGYPGPIHSGALIIAMKENVPVVPCGIETFGWSRRNLRRCSVVFGDPISFDDLPRNGRGYKQAAGILEDELVRLWRQAAEAVAAGFPPELPDGTKRAGWIRPGRDVRAAAPPRVNALTSVA